MENRNPPETIEQAEAVDLLDVALTITENIRLLILGPIIIGAIAYGSSSFLPAIYESTAILQPLPAVSIPVRENEVAPNPSVIANTAATKMTTANMLNSAIQKVRQSDETLPRGDLQASVRTAVGRNDNLITLIVSSTSPTASQLIASEILEITYAESRPKTSDLNRLITEKGSIEEQLKIQKITGERIQILIARSDNTPEFSDLAKTHALIASNLVDLHHRLKGIETQLRGITEDMLVQSPSLPAAPVSPKRITISVLSALSAGFFLLIGVFIRHAWHLSTTSPQNEMRIKALKRKYGFSK